MSEKRAVYGGSFDPPTLGHENVLAQAVELFDIVYVIVATNAIKEPWIKPIDRSSLWMNIIKQADYGDRVRLHEFSSPRTNLYRTAYEAYGVQWAVRGIRGPRDLEDERDLRAANRAMTPGVSPVYLLSPPELAHISSSMVRAIVQPRLDGWQQDIDKFVSPIVADYLRYKFNNTQLERK